ncbi:GNAT family N-acetyltransferase [Kineococcus sp. SYSU DK003]|uniref:GNAT family N-acetyltransferase n=1 Tax=Kineococcus sp. SYSU DK003 TaxID=3383124 RepID=UPI003D7D30E5
MPILVRAWEPTDAAPTLELFRLSVHVTAAADYSPVQRAAWTPPGSDVAQWGRRRAAAGTRVAVRDGLVAGFADLSEDGHVGMFHVHPDHARRGVGTALWRDLLGLATARRLARLTVDASLTARPFFENVGFTLVRPQLVRRGGQEFTDLAMQLHLPTGPLAGADRPGAPGETGETGPPDDEPALLRRAEARQRAGAALLERLHVVELLSALGPVRTMGSLVSGLVVDRDLDVAVRVGADFSPGDVATLLARLASLPGVEGFDVADERGGRTPGEQRDERFHVVVRVREAAERDAAAHDADRGADESWRLDLSLFLHDDHAHVAELHERWREELSRTQRAAVLRIKEAWYRRPDYPGGWAVCRAVLDGGARTREQAESWLRRRQTTAGPATGRVTSCAPPAPRTAPGARRASSPEQALGSPHIVWDMDGTLIDSSQVVPAAFVEAVAELGGPAVDVEEVVAAYSLGVPEAVLGHLLRRALRPGEAEAYYRRLEAVSVEPCPGVRQTLAALRAHGHRIAVFTGAAVRGARSLLHAAGLQVDLLVGGDLVQRPKPAPDGLLLTARLLDVAPSRLVYVGDAPTDLLAAQAAGARAVAAAWGHLYDPGAPAHDTWPSPDAALAALDVPARTAGGRR